MLTLVYQCPQTLYFIEFVRLLTAPQELGLSEEEEAEGEASGEVDGEVDAEVDGEIDGEIEGEIEGEVDADAVGPAESYDENAGMEELEETGEEAEKKKRPEGNRRSDDTENY